ncbi:MAG: hypothetical protein OXD44_05190 [Gammaproteobacteria bacterium]|nr:hypothetical protein [Gammaproteobacteria bacterium]
MNSEQAVLVGIVAGEVSGDALGAGFISEFKTLYPNARFIGVGGPRMREAGCEILYDMGEIGVMGLDDLPDLDTQDSTLRVQYVDFEKPRCICWG